MNKLDGYQIFEEVKANHKKLESCQKHSFNIDLEPDRRVGKRWRCSSCGGEVGIMEKSWYEKGLKHQ